MTQQCVDGLRYMMGDDGVHKFEASRHLLGQDEYRILCERAGKHLHLKRRSSSASFRTSCEGKQIRSKSDDV